MSDLFFSVTSIIIGICGFLYLMFSNRNNQSSNLSTLKHYEGLIGFGFMIICGTMYLLSTLKII